MEKYLIISIPINSRYEEILKCSFDQNYCINLEVIAVSAQGIEEANIIRDNLLEGGILLSCLDNIPVSEGKRFYNELLKRSSPYFFIKEVTK